MIRDPGSDGYLKGWTGGGWSAPVRPIATAAM
jgi:hypothetical protein